LNSRIIAVNKMQEVVDLALANMRRQRAEESAIKAQQMEIIANHDELIKQLTERLTKLEALIEKFKSERAQK
jgi:hypothetical protein